MNPTRTIALLGTLSLSLCATAAAQCSGNSTVAHTTSTTQPAMGAVASRAGSDIVDTAVANGSFRTLAAALQAADLVGTLKGDGPFTVFAPTDEAFAKLPPGTVEMLLKPENKAKLVAILTYHVAPGKLTADKVAALRNAPTVEGQRVDIVVKDGKVMLDKATVIKADIACSNGVIHVIDTVIMPASMNVVELAEGAGTFKTLLAAAKAAGLVDALTAKGPITVFAPTDEAFARLPAGTVEGLLKPENKDKLAAILKYHIVAGRVYADQAVKLGKASTLEGQPVAIASTGGKVSVNNATVVAADLDASNGVVHVVDTVLMPK